MVSKQGSKGGRSPYRGENLHATSGPKHSIRVFYWFCNSVDLADLKDPTLRLLTLHRTTARTNQLGCPANLICKERRKPDCCHVQVPPLFVLERNVVDLADDPKEYGDIGHRIDQCIVGFTSPPAYGRRDSGKRVDVAFWATYIKKLGDVAATSGQISDVNVDRGLTRYHAAGKKALRGHPSPHTPWLWRCCGSEKINRTVSVVCKR